MTVSTSTRSRRLAACLMLAVGVLPLAGCSSAGDTTCSEFYDMNSDERIDVLKDLLREHDLVVYDPVNLSGVTKAVLGYCTTNPGSATLEEAVDWDSSYW
ncbi:hypothetical protein [Actinomyces respiraculi]|uniref:hypothetical protein n=1 Tax=Actinomyces respiraculi TaxID=2744574 RepID=UPI00141FB972|nr:hypothetical protein [Actinomyces respiraculi]